MKRNQPITVSVSLIGVLMGLLVGCPTETESTTVTRTASLTTPEWAEGIAITALAEAVLEEELDYDVTVEYLDVEDAYASVADGDNDALMDTWLPDLHADYWNTYGEQLDDRGAVYIGAITGLAVPQFVADDGITTLSDLAGESTAEKFDNEINGIDSGAGIMQIIEESIIPDYGLDDYTLSDGSFETMVEALDAAVTAEEYIVVPLWQPHPLFGKHDLHMLIEDDADIFTPNEIRIVTRTGMEADDHMLHAFLTEMEFSDGDLEDLMYSIDESSLPTLTAASEWKAQNRSVWIGWISTE